MYNGGMRANQTRRQGDRETGRSIGHRLLLVVAATFFAPNLPQASADVIVLANRTRASVACRVEPLTGAPANLNLAPRDVVPVFVDGRANLTFASGRERKQYLLDANSAYYFGQSKDGRLDLQQIGLGGDRTTNAGRKLAGSAATAPAAVIPVMLYVDEEEPAKQSVWERKLRLVRGSTGREPVLRTPSSP